jgi:hypothetical protein
MDVVGWMESDDDDKVEGGVLTGCRTTRAPGTHQVEYRSQTDRSDPGGINSLDPFSRIRV